MTGAAVCHSTASDTGELLPDSKFIDVHRTASAMDAGVQFPSPLAVRFPEHPSHNKIVDYITTYLGNPTRLFDWAAKSSAVFASDGPARSTFQAYWTRILALRNAGEQDGYYLNSTSEFYFWRFVVNLGPRLRKSNLVLVDNGNLRTVWKDDQGTRLGLQFLSDGMIQYVIFKRRGAGQPPSRVAGRDTFDGVKKQIHAFDLASLIYE